MSGSKNFTAYTMILLKDILKLMQIIDHKSIEFFDIRIIFKI